MSYDLYLASPQLDREAFARYFEGRAHYGGVGAYSNDDTGVYFTFHFDHIGVGDDEAPQVLRAPHAQFNLNYFRPHVFGLEAERELTAFVTAFGCAIHDPQSKGMGEGPYTPEGFLRGWNSGNKTGYDVLAGRGGDDMLLVDDAAIERVWRCNLRRQAAQAKLGETYFAPRVSWAKDLRDGAPIVFAVWGEGVATAFPECATHVLLTREARAAGPFGIGGKKNGLEVKLLPMADVAALDGCGWRDDESGRVLLAPARLPPSRAVRSVFEGGFGRMNELLKGYAPDRLLNSSLMP